MGIEQAYNTNAKKALLLTAEDPAPFTTIKGTSNLLFTFPHNEILLPKGVEDCLGTDKDWFAKAHEARDLYMANIFEIMRERFPEATLHKGNYSRLVADINAHPDEAIKRTSSEWDNIIIPKNQHEECCEEQASRRMNEIYYPYHQAQKAIINEIRAAHDGIIVLDMHSFSPTWKNNPRTEEIGTIRAHKTDLSKALESFLKNQNDYSYVSGKPYRVADREKNAARYIEAECDLQYLGIEIRNDLISTQEGQNKFIDFIEKSVDHIRSLEHTDPHAYLRATEKASLVSPLPPRPKPDTTDHAPYTQRVGKKMPWNSEDHTLPTLNA